MPFFKSSVQDGDHGVVCSFLHGSAQGPVSPGGYPVGSLSHQRCPQDQALSSASPRQPRCSGNLASLATFSTSLSPAELVATSASPPRWLAHQSKLPASRSRRPRDLFSGQIHSGASIPRSVPRRASIRPQVPVVCGARSSGTSAFPNRTCTKRAYAFASLQKDRFRMMVAAWSCFPCLQRIDSG